MTIIYQAYGLQDVMRQTIFSVVSLISRLKNSTQLKIVIYTEQPEYFQEFFKGETRVVFEVVTMEQIKKWRGAIDFVHRVKIEILKDASKKYPGTLFYADGDTHYRSSPLPLFQQVNDRTSLMHIAENSLAGGKDPISKKMNRFVKRNSFKIDGEEIRLGSQTVMWNAGVIGLSENNKNLFPKILQLTDEMHLRYPKHVTEQLSVSYFLQTTTAVIPADKVVYHYWNQKPEYQERIDSFLSKNKNLSRALADFEHFVFPGAPKPKEKMLKKILKKFTGKSMQEKSK